MASNNPPHTAQDEELKIQFCNTHTHNTNLSLVREMKSMKELEEQKNDGSALMSPGR